MFQNRVNECVERDGLHWTMTPTGDSWLRRGPSHAGMAQEYYYQPAAHAYRNAILRFNGVEQEMARYSGCVVLSWPRRRSPCRHLR